ncbi:MAG: serine/threonine-protein kinase [Kofleriaceae bacterium]
MARKYPPEPGIGSGLQHPVRGRQVARYVLGELLGRGGTAEVFAGFSVGDQGFRRPVALKRLLPALANDPMFLDRLIGEAKMLVGMQHGNIVSVLDLAREGEDTFLVMDLIDGPSLAQLQQQRQHAAMPYGLASYIVQSAAQGLAFAHGRMIVHADVSPSNLLLTTSGEVRVADFGVARREGRDPTSVEGKWAYMPPEQVRGAPLTPQADVFALGVVLYELVTGAHPFESHVTRAARESARSLPIMPPRTVRASVPPGLDAICMRALAHDPRQRYVRMQHMIDVLVEERFANHWRDGAGELAALIRETHRHSATQEALATMYTARPLTLVTRSLLIEPGQSVEDDDGDILTGQETIAFERPSIAYHPPIGGEVGPVSIAHSAVPMPIETTPSPRASGTQQLGVFMPTSRRAETDLASVHGGTITNSHHLPQERGLERWLLLAIIAGILVGAGIAIAAYSDSGSELTHPQTEPSGEPR